MAFDFEIDFSNGGGLQGQGFRLDLDGDDIDDAALAEYIVRDLRLLMVEEVRILRKNIIAEAHKRTVQERCESRPCSGFERCAVAVPEPFRPATPPPGDHPPLVDALFGLTGEAMLRHAYDYRGSSSVTAARSTPSPQPGCAAWRRL